MMKEKKKRYCFYIIFFLIILGLVIIMMKKPVITLYYKRIMICLYWNLKVQEKIRIENPQVKKYEYYFTIDKAGALMCLEGEFSDLNSLKEIPYLTILDLSNTQLKNLDFLRDMNIEVFILANNKVELLDISALNTLPNLEGLFIYNCKINAISVLNKYPKEISTIVFENITAYDIDALHLNVKHLTIQSK